MPSLPRRKDSSTRAVRGESDSIKSSLPTEGGVLGIGARHVAGTDTIIAEQGDMPLTKGESQALRRTGAEGPMYSRREPPLLHDRGRQEPFPNRATTAATGWTTRALRTGSKRLMGRLRDPLIGGAPMIAEHPKQPLTCRPSMPLCSEPARLSDTVTGRSLRVAHWGRV